MKILCLADLHCSTSKKRRQKFNWIRSLVNQYNPDVIVIAGDIFENDAVFRFDPYEKFNQITDGKISVICTLGNHEFAYQPIERVHLAYMDKYNPKKYNVHYLDCIGHYDIGDVRFVGNVLWYNGDMKWRENQNIYDWGDGRWLDKTIVDFDYEKENQRCVDQIMRNLSTDKTNILVTHCLPHEDLNGHAPSDLSAFSGMKNLLKDVDVAYSISGHTHWRVVGKELESVDCINIGNDYNPPYYHYLLEI